MAKIVRVARRVAQEVQRAARNFRRGAAYDTLARIDFHSGLGDSAWFLYGLVRALKPQVCVEIGSARGQSACYVGMGLKENGGGRLVAIDPHCPTDWNDFDSVDTSDTIRRNLGALRLQEYVEVWRETSRQARAHWEGPIDLLFIDGDHSYEGVRQDWDDFSPLVGPFGFVVFHDTLWDLQTDHSSYRADLGVPRFVEELRGQGYPVQTLGRDFGVSVVQPVRGGVPLAPPPGATPPR